jgi:hypothetical protein
MINDPEKELAQNDKIKITAEDSSYFYITNIGPYILYSSYQLNEKLRQGNTWLAHKSQVTKVEEPKPKAISGQYYTKPDQIYRVIGTKDGRVCNIQTRREEEFDPSIMKAYNPLEEDK